MRLIEIVFYNRLLYSKGIKGIMRGVFFLRMV